MLFKWCGESAVAFDQPLKVLKTFKKFQPRPFPATISSLIQPSLAEAIVPQQSLQDTALHFIRMLEPDQLEVLKQKLDKLDGKVLRAGSTCSGSDIAIVMLHWTLEALNKFFEATCQRRSTDCYRTALYYSTVPYLCSLQYCTVLCCTVQRRAIVQHFPLLLNAQDMILRKAEDLVLL